MVDLFAYFVVQRIQGFRPFQFRERGGVISFLAIRCRTIDVRHDPRFRLLGHGGRPGRRRFEGLGGLHRGRRDRSRFFDNNGERRAPQLASARDYFYLARTARLQLTVAIDRGDRLIADLPFESTRKILLGVIRARFSARESRFSLSSIILCCSS